MDKANLKLEIRDDKEKKEVMKTVYDLSGVESISMDMKEKKLTVIGDIDAVNIESKLTELCHTEIVSVVREKKTDDEIVSVAPISGIIKVDTSYNPRIPSYPPPKSGDDGTSGCACVIL